MRTHRTENKARADLLFGVGLGTFAGVWTVLILPRVGVLALELLASSVLIAYGAILRRRAKRADSEAVQPEIEQPRQVRQVRFDRCDVAIVLLALFFGALIQALRPAGLAKEYCDAFALLVLGVAILAKPWLVRRLGWYHEAAAAIDVSRPADHYRSLHK